jgi:hypothetical protein
MQSDENQAILAACFMLVSSLVYTLTLQQYVLLRQWLTFTGLCDITSHKTELFTAITVRTSNPTCYFGMNSAYNYLV